MGIFGGFELFDMFEELGSLATIALVVAIISTVLAFIFVVPEKRLKSMNGFTRALHDIFNFKFLIIEKILQALYIFVTCFVLLCGFFMLFVTVDYFYDSKWLGGYGIIVMLLGPIVVRLFYELLMMLILLVKNVIAINVKLTGKGGSDTAVRFGASPIDYFGKKTEAGTGSHARKASFCTRCGSPLDPSGVCPNCGKRG